MTTQLSDHRVELEPITPKRRQPWPWPVALAVALLAPIGIGLVLIGGGAWWHFGSASAAAALLRGDALHLEPSDFDMGSVGFGEAQELALRMTNLSGRTITIYGTPSICGQYGCVGSFEAFPIDLPPWSARALTLVATFAGTRGEPMRQETVIFTSLGNRKIAIFGEIRDSVEIQDPEAATLAHLDGSVNGG